jgi:hypothetical protein
MLILGAILAKLGWEIIHADRVEVSKNCARAGNWRDILLGRVRTKDDWLPDSRVQGGMVYNRRKQRIEISGRLSVESLHRVFKRCPN